MTLGRVLAEVAARRRFDAVQTVAEIHLVQVELEDLRLAVDALDARREDQFLDFAAIRLVRRQKALTRELLGDRAAALRLPPVPDVGQRRGGDADEVEAAVIVEPLILDRDERLRQVGRNLGQRHFDPLLLEDGEGELIRIVEDRGRLVHLADATQGVEVGKALAEADEEPDTSADRQDRGECERASDDQARCADAGVAPPAIRA